MSRLLELFGNKHEISVPTRPSQPLKPVITIKLGDVPATSATTVTLPTIKENDKMATIYGVYKRKDIQFADQQAVERCKSLIGRHPWTIANTEEFATEYAQIFGVDELAILKASCSGGKFNMVISTNSDWVVGGTFVAYPPKAEEVLKPGYKWVNTPFSATGRTQVPEGQATANAPVAITELSENIEKQIAGIVFDSVTAALKAWASTEQ